MTISSSRNNLVIDIEKVDKTEFNESEWQFKNLINYNSKDTSKPFTSTLTELMRVKLP